MELYFLRGYFFSSCIITLILLGFGSVEVSNGQFYRTVGEKKLAWHRIIVDQSGHGNFTTVQSAIDSIPSYNKFWVSIKINAGVYREKVIIPYDKPYIILEGKGKKKTSIFWDDHITVAQSPTFTSLADNIIVKCLSFVNLYNSPVFGNKNPRRPAVAALISGDKSSFYRCGFFGLQDTLWDDRGRHYYHLCTIQGAVDFIFGSGQSIFERCSISVVAGALGPGLPGYITAQSRSDPEEQNGFVFKGCKVSGSGSSYLGRPWRGYSRVVFFNSNFSNIIHPEGWDAWHFVGLEYQLTYAEEGCYGQGSDTSQRVSWEKKLSLDTVQQLTNMSFIDNEGWIQNQPL